MPSTESNLPADKAEATLLGRDQVLEVGELDVDEVAEGKARGIGDIADARGTRSNMPLTVGSSPSRRKARRSGSWR